MNDLSFFQLQLRKGTLASQLPRDVLDFAKPHADEGTLFSWRWHFLLGILPVPAEDDVALEACRAACKRWTAQWQDAGRRLDQCTRAAPARAGRAVRFDESSSDTDDGVAPAGASAATAAAAPLAGLATSGVVAVNPLVPAVESSYALQFQADAVRHSVAKDMSRLFWDAPLFRDPRTKEAVSDILLKYCLMEDREYKQGLHEVVAFLYYACHRDQVLAERFAREQPSLRGSAVLALFEQVYADVSAAVYALFRRIVGEEDGGLGLARWYYVDNERDQSGVVVACERVQQDLLVRVDAPLQHLLDAEYGIQSVVYLVRWLRLLFLRELPFEQLLPMWTVLFCERFVAAAAATPFVLDNSVALYLAAQMLRHIHDGLAHDAGDALRLLMKYPPVAHVTDLLYSAIVSNVDSCLLRLATAPRLVDPRDAAPLPPEVTLRQGEALSRVVAALEQYWFRDPNASAEEQEWVTEVYIHSIARIKKVRDVLLYGMDE